MPAKESVYWFPMRVTYNRELKMKECLDNIGVENFLPLRYAIIDTAEGRKRKLVPAVSNLIFVHSTREKITQLKMFKREFEPLRYMMRSSASGYEVIVVPDAQMENFIRVASVLDDSVFFLEMTDFLNQVGTRVLITEGPFAGVVGLVRRIQKNKHVVVSIEGVASVAIAYVPVKCLMIVER